jgi:hypothetical protein
MQQCLSGTARWPLGTIATEMAAEILVTERPGDGSWAEPRCDGSGLPRLTT